MTSPTMEADAVIGRVELELAPTRPNHARVDVGGSRSAKGCWPDREQESVGGLVVVRVTPRHALRLTVWTELAYDLAQAANAAIWRRIERREARSW